MYRNSVQTNNTKEKDMQLEYSTFLQLNTVSKTAMNVFLQLVRYQNQHGKVHGAYYRFFMRTLGFKSKQTFYNVLEKLDEKGLILIKHTTHGDYDIIVKNNTYENQKKKDYINLNRKIFQSREFFEMKAHEKYMMIDMIRSTQLNRGLRVIGVEEFYQKYKEIFGVTKRIVREYLATIRQYFKVWIKSGNYYIQFIGGELFEEETEEKINKKNNKSYRVPKSGTKQKREYDATVLMRRHKMATSKESDVSDLAELMTQYRPTINKIYNGNNPNVTDSAALWDAFTDVMQTVSERLHQFEIKTFHKILRTSLGLA